MEGIKSLSTDKITKSFVTTNNPRKLLLTVVIISIILGSLTGFILANKNKRGGLASAGLGQPAKNPQSDKRTFRDFAEGTIKPRPQPSDPGEYVEGTHLLERVGAVPVALTSSVVDLSQYEGKKVKVYGETQKALKEGWLMDIGKVEEIK
ncbi:hypothetical protein HYW41_01620 [Candidatus Daviesbacteria bacterium]|nr:hypothetical protein [Candidatus Daviesbacteria bacterium]